MGAPTVTRAELRKKIGRKLTMPFFKYFNTNPTADAGSTTAKLVDADLTQVEHYWEGSWIYSPTAEAVRQVISFDAAADTIYPDRASAFSYATTEYELLTGWSAYSIHDAINSAISKAFPAFFQVTQDETLVVQDFRLDYALTVGTNATNGSDGYLTYAPYRILSIEVERPSLAKTGGVASSSSTTVTVETTMDISDVTSAWYVSVYDGTGRGQYRKVISKTGQQITISSGSTPWTTNPDTTSKVHVWDPTDEKRKWTPLWAVKFDRKEWPSVMYLAQNYPGANGCRLRITYIHKPAEMTTDASTTVVPEEFIIPFAISILAGERIPNNKYDRDRYTKMRADYMAEAEEYKRNYYWNTPQGTPWQEEDPVGMVGYFPEPGDPLGWRSNY
jgi:hypothetical protein